MPSQPPALRVIIDTREQCPWSFPAWVDTRRGTLQAGDYALDGDKQFAIERKSLDDFLGTISTGWDRFKREIGRMTGWNIRVIIVEGDFERVCFRVGSEGEIIPPQHSHPMLSPSFVCRRVAELTFLKTSVIFAGNAGQAGALAYHMLKVREEEMGK
jgi:hypothetical protein